MQKHSRNLSKTRSTTCPRRRFDLGAFRSTLESGRVLRGLSVEVSRLECRRPPRDLQGTILVEGCIFDPHTLFLERCFPSSSPSMSHVAHWGRLQVPSIQTSAIGIHVFAILVIFSHPKWDLSCHPS